MDGSWTIAELAELAAGTLAAGGPPGHGMTRANGRVRDVPNERLIRWYGTVGLVDPPLSRRGRVARYGPRHLLQLVAIKRRQAEGRSLAEIQAELAGATNASLAVVARVPDAVLMARTAAVAGPADAPAPAARSARALDGPDAVAAVAVVSQAPARFWAQRPGPDTDSAQARPRGGGRPQAGGGGRPRAGGPDAGRGAISGGQDGPRLVCGVWLAPGVTMLLDGAEREPGPGDLAVITAAAGPLLEVLASIGLSPQDSSASAAPPGGPPDDPDGQERSRS